MSLPTKNSARVGDTTYMIDEVLDGDSHSAFRELSLRAGRGLRVIRVVASVNEGALLFTECGSVIYCENFNCYFTCNGTDDLAQVLLLFGFYSDLNAAHFELVRTSHFDRHTA